MGGRIVFRYTKYAIFFLVSLCLVTYFTLPAEPIENDVAKRTPQSNLDVPHPEQNQDKKTRGTVTGTPAIPAKQSAIGPLNTVGVVSKDPNKTLDWLDLWANDTVCNRFSVHLLEDNAVEPRTLVSFPGSGNTWLRILLMGLTGIYVDTVYPGDETFPTKGKSRETVRHNVLLLRYEAFLLMRNQVWKQQVVKYSRSLR